MWIVFWYKNFEEMLSFLFFSRVEESYEEDCYTEGRVHKFIRILIPNDTVSRLRSLFNHLPTNSSTYVFCANIGISNNINNSNNNNNNNSSQTFAVSWMLYSFFWVIPRRLKLICRRFGTLFHLHRQVGVCRICIHLLACEDGTDRVFRNVGI